MTEETLCPVPEAQPLDDYDRLMEAWQADKHWIHFFIRPCCPAPVNEVAESMIAKLKADVDAAGFTPEQTQDLKAVADQRLEWYRKLSVRKGK